MSARKANTVPDRLNELDEILAAGDEAKREREQEAANAATAKTAWENQFAEFIASVVLPVFKPYAERLRERGYDVTLSSHKGKLNISRDGVGAQMQVVPVKTMLVQLEMTASQTTRKPYPIDELTQEELEDNLIDLIKVRFGR